jgi:uncharacterized FAD-dependent dehydrogenase
MLPTSAQKDHLAINGMSYHARNSGYANAAVVVNVNREDFFQGDPLDGMRFQQRIEQLAFKEGGGGYLSPAQRLVDFLKGRDSKGELKSTYKPGVTAARLDRILPEFVVTALQNSLHTYNQKMQGFISPEALVAAMSDTGKFTMGAAYGITEDVYDKPYKLPAYVAAGAAFGYVGTPILAKSNLK